MGGQSPSFVVKIPSQDTSGRRTSRMLNIFLIVRPLRLDGPVDEADIGFGYVMVHPDNLRFHRFLVQVFIVVNPVKVRP